LEVDKSVNEVKNTKLQEQQRRRSKNVGRLNDTVTEGGTEEALT